MGKPDELPADELANFNRYLIWPDPKLHPRTYRARYPSPRLLIRTLSPVPRPTHCGGWSKMLLLRLNGKRREGGSHDSQVLVAACQQTPAAGPAGRRASRRGRVGRGRWREVTPKNDAHKDNPQVLVARLVVGR